MRCSCQCLYLERPIFNSTGHLLGPVDCADSYHHLPRPVQNPLGAGHLGVCRIGLLRDVLKALDHYFLHLEEPFLHHTLRLFFFSNGCDATTTSCVWFTFASAGTMMVEKGTTSFSPLTMAVTFWSSVNCSLAIPSKHFLRWGWTRVGSLVSERISNSSSLERKKNLHEGRGGQKGELWM